MASTKGDMQLKLVVNTEIKKVLFAEAGKDFVDVLFSFLTLPLGTIVRLVEKESNIGPLTIGSLNSLYHGVEALDDNSMWAPEFKKCVLRPDNLADEYCHTLKLNIDNTDPNKSFVSFRDETVSYYKRLQKGFVNDDATFVITDDLTVIPNSVDYSVLAQIQDLKIKDPCSLMEITVNVTTRKVLDLLKCSLVTTSCLTDLFLKKEELIHMPTFFSPRVENDSSIKFKLRLVIKKSDGKVLYAHGDRYFANMLLCFLTFPLGGVLRELGRNSCEGSIDGLYKSMVDLNDVYFMSEAKNKLLDLRLPLLKKLFESKSPTNNGGHQVKDLNMFSVTDDLVMLPSSPISDLNLISSSNISIFDLKEKVVNIGLVESFNILKASLTSKSALTTGLGHLLHDVFESSSEVLCNNEDSESSYSSDSSYEKC